MKKFLLSLIALLGVGTYALADGFSVADVEIRSGKSGVLELAFNTSFYGRSFQLDFDLPEGIEASVVQKGEAVTAADGKYMIDGNVYEGAYRVAYTDFDGSILENGVAAYITLNDTQGYDPGTEFTVTVKNQEYLYQETAEAGSRLIKANPDDFTFKIKIVEDCIIFDETATTLPSYTAGEKSKVRMTRKMAAGKWSTIVLPFTMTNAKLKAAFGDNVEFANFSGWSAEYDFDQDMAPKSIEINFTKRAVTPNLPGGVAMLVKPSKDVETFEVDAVTLVSTVNDNNTSQSGIYSNTHADEYDTQGVFKGTFVSTKVPADGLFISGEKFYYSKGDTNIKAFRGWFELGAVLNKETEFGIKMNILVDGEETAVDGITFVDSKGAVYTIDGKFVGRDVDLKKLQKGIYVIDGKKVAIK